jgi:hypothetical protein
MNYELTLIYIIVIIIIIYIPNIKIAEPKNIYISLLSLLIITSNNTLRGTLNVEV